METATMFCQKTETSLECAERQLRLAESVLETETRKVEFGQKAQRVRHAAETVSTKWGVVGEAMRMECALQAMEA